MTTTPAALNLLVPMAHVRNVSQSIEFYRKLGFEGEIPSPRLARKSLLGPGWDQAGVRLMRAR